MKISWLMRIILAVWALFLVACASQSLTQRDAGDLPREPHQSVTNEDGNTTVRVDANQTGLSLADYLRKVPGLTVRGNGPDAQVSIRGFTSIMSGTEPLYVINGTPVNDTFAGVSSFLHPNDIVQVDVLKDASATGAWGVRGANGVILIKTR